MSEEDRKKDVFAHFGAAVYFAHCVEASMQHVLLAFEFRANANPTWTQSDYEAEFERFDNKFRTLTFGNLRKRIEPFISDEIFTALGEAKEKRDWLAHGYWFDRAGEMMLEGGEEFLIAELEAIRLEFAQLDESLVEIYQPEWEKYGITDTMKAEAKTDLLKIADTRIGKRDA